MTSPSPSGRRSTASPLRYRTMQDGAFELLRDRIFDGTLKPGERLPIRDLARELELSTMPVREALVRLEAIGLVTQVPHRGAMVTDLSLRDLNDFYNVRAMLEPRAAELGAEAVAETGLAELRSIFEEFERAVERQDVEAVLALDEAFLAAIYGAVGNAFLSQLIRSVWDRVKPYKLLYTTTAQVDAAEFILDADRRILAACQRSDGAEAARVLERSLDTARLELAGLLERQQRRTAGDAGGVTD